MEFIGGNATQIQAKGGIGSGATIGQGSYSEGPIQVATVGMVVNLLMSQASELRQRCATVASQIAGAIPDGAEKNQPPQNLIEVLQSISSDLGRALSELDRTQSRL